MDLSGRIGMRRPGFFIIAVVLVLILLAGCSGGKENTTINNTTGDVSDDFQGIEFDRNHLLPIGSIVTLKGYFKKVMICGIGTGLVTDEGNVFYDYAGCYYPAGVSGAKQYFLFNNDAIDKVYFIGYEDEEGQEYRDIMEDVIKEERKGKRPENMERGG